MLVKIKKKDGGIRFIANVIEVVVDKPHIRVLAFTKGLDKDYLSKLFELDEIEFVIVNNKIIYEDRPKTCNYKKEPIIQPHHRGYDYEKNKR